jgi:hypothetical protein
MPGRSTLDPDNRPVVPPGHDGPPLGPSDSSDSGSDIGGEAGADTDRYGTGERLSADDPSSQRPGADLGADRVVGAEEAGLGGGLDQAEEAILGKTDEDIAREARLNRRGGQA